MLSAFRRRDSHSPWQTLIDRKSWKVQLPSFDYETTDHHFCGMCGRIIQSTGPVNLAIVDALDVRDRRLDNFPRRYNGAPSQELLVIRQNHKRRSHLGAASLGPHPLLVQRSKRRPTPDQCDGRDCALEADVSGSLRAPALHRAD
jgi:hypothetical protein